MFERESAAIIDYDPEEDVDLQAEAHWDDEREQNYRIKIGDQEGQWMTLKRVNALQRLLARIKRVHKRGLGY